MLRANTDKIHPGFLYDCLVTDWFVDAMGRLERGASYPAVRDSDVFNAQIPLPPLAEQRKIAEVLGVVQRAMEQQGRLLALTGELKRALLHKLVRRHFVCCHCNYFFSGLSRGTVWFHRLQAPREHATSPFEKENHSDLRRERKRKVQPLRIAEGACEP